MLGCAI